MMSHGLAMRIAESVGVPVTSIEPTSSGGVKVTARSHVTEEDAQKLLLAFENCGMPGQTFEVVIASEPMHKWSKKMPPEGSYSPARQAVIDAGREAAKRAEEEHARRVAAERGLEFERLREEFGDVVDEALARKP